MTSVSLDEKGRGTKQCSWRKRAMHIIVPDDKSSQASDLEMSR